MNLLLAMAGILMADIAAFRMLQSLEMTVKEGHNEEKEIAGGSFILHHSAGCYYFHVIFHVQIDAPGRSVTVGDSFPDHQRQFPPGQSNRLGW